MAQIGEMNVGQQFKGKTGALLTIIGKEPDRVQVKNEKEKEYYLHPDYNPEEKMTSEKELQETGRKALEESPFANVKVTEKPRNNNNKVVVPKRPKVRERFLELLKAGATRAEVNEQMKETSIPTLFNYSLERLEERGITIQRPVDKKTGKYYATGTLISKKTATIKNHPRIVKLSKKVKKNLK